MRLPYLPMLPLLALAACGSHDRGTSIAINADGGNTLAAVDGGSGEVKLALPGLEGKFKLPRIKLDASNFDLNGVHLYPGSTIDNVDVASAGKDGSVRIAFTSPATPGVVRGWFQERLSKVGFSLHPDGAGLSGTTDEDKPFRLDLAGAGGDHAKGTITLGS